MYRLLIGLAGAMANVALAWLGDREPVNAAHVSGMQQQQQQQQQQQPCSAASPVTELTVRNLSSGENISVCCGAAGAVADWVRMVGEVGATPGRAGNASAGGGGGRGGSGEGVSRGQGRGGEEEAGAGEAGAPREEADMVGAERVGSWVAWAEAVFATEAEPPSLTTYGSGGWGEGAKTALDASAMMGPGSGGGVGEEQGARGRESGEEEAGGGGGGGR